MGPDIKIRPKGYEVETDPLGLRLIAGLGWRSLQGVKGPRLSLLKVEKLAEANPKAWEKHD